MSDATIAHKLDEALVHIADAGQAYDASNHGIGTMHLVAAVRLLEQTLRLHIEAKPKSPQGGLRLVKTEKGESK